MKKLVIFFLFVQQGLFAQNFWERTEPYAGTINKMYFGGVDTIYGTLNSGFTRSTDNGTTWSMPIVIDYVTDMAVAQNGTIFLSENSYKISRSTNKGTSWTKVGNGIVEKSCNTVMATSAGTILAGTGAGIYRSTDNGDNWTKVAGAAEFGADSNIVSMATYDGNTLYAISRSGFSVNPPKTYAIHSTDDGVTWTKGANSLDSVSIFKALVTPGGAIIGRTNNALRISSDGGNNWSALGFYNRSIYDIAVGNGGEIYATISGDSQPSNLYKTTDNGASWTTIQMPFNNKASIAISKGGDIFIGQEQMYRSTDGGATWKGLPLSYPIVSVMSESPKHELFLAAGGNSYAYLYRSSDFGITWKIMNTGVVGNPCIGFHADTMYVGDNYYSGTVYRSTDSGATFKAIPNNINLGGYVNNLLGTSSSMLFAATSNGIYRSTDPTKSWEKVFSTGINSLKQSPNGTLFARREWPGDGMYRSNDGGTTWEQKMNGISLIYHCAQLRYCTERRHYCRNAEWRISLH